MCNQCFIHQNIYPKKSYYAADERDDSDEDQKGRKAGVILFDRNDRVLLVQSKYHDVWGIPKGGVKIGESDHNAAARELKEETGISIKRDVLKVSKLQGKIVTGKTLFYYSHRLNRKRTIKLPANTDVRGYAWVRSECLADFNLNIFTRRLIAPIIWHLLEKNNRVVPMEIEETPIRDDRMADMPLRRNPARKCRMSRGAKN